MFVAAFAGTPAVGLAASAVMWRERSLAEIADAGDLAQHPAALFNEGCRDRWWPCLSPSAYGYHMQTP